MKQDCLDIGELQAFMDGELSHVEIARVSGHLEVCDSCAFMLGQAEDEASLVFSALDREFNTLVPTQRLWTKINESIETQRENRPFWQKARAFLASAFANPSMVAAAGLLIVVGGFSVLLIDRGTDPRDLAAVQTPVNKIRVSESEQAGTSTPVAAEPVAKMPGDSIGDRVVDGSLRAERIAYRPRMAVSSRVAGPEESRPALVNGYLEGEESYVKTISSLVRTVDDQKETVLRPAERVAYERDMAVVNDSIARMRQEVRRNPRNEMAKQVLYSSYQNKIDLLNSVSQKEELVASLQE